MRQVWIPRFGAPTVFEVREAADPQPGPGEVRVKVEAAGVNFADVQARTGLYPDAPPLPFVVGYEVAGVIDAVGEGVDAARIGQAVMAMTRFGGYSSMIVVPDLQAIPRPPGLDAVHGAAIPVVYATAWMMLEEMGRIRAGDRVLVHSAGGGVGLAALDLIKWRGAYAIGTASPGKHAFLKERGFDQVVDYKQDLEQSLKDQPGLDLILDPIGGDSWTQGLRLLRPGGRLICFGFSSNSTGETRNVLAVMRNLASVPWLKMNPISLMNENKGVMGVNMGHMWHEGPRIVGWLREILALWSEGKVRPMVHAEVPFSKAGDAHRILQERKNVGKVILIPD